MSERPTKITFAEMRDMGVRGILVYCADFRCSHSITLSADQRPDDLRLSDIEDRFVCQACGKRCADVRPDFNWNRRPGAVMGYRENRRGSERHLRIVDDETRRTAHREILDPRAKFYCALECRVSRAARAAYALIREGSNLVHVARSAMFLGAAASAAQ